MRIELALTRLKDSSAVKNANGSLVPISHSVSAALIYLKEEDVRTKLISCRPWKSAQPVW